MPTTAGQKTKQRLAYLRRSAVWRALTCVIACIMGTFRPTVSSRRRSCRSCCVAIAVAVLSVGCDVPCQWRGAMNQSELDDEKELEAIRAHPTPRSAQPARHALTRKEKSGSRSPGTLSQRSLFVPRLCNNMMGDAGLVKKFSSLITHPSQKHLGSNRSSQKKKRKKKKNGPSEAENFLNGERRALGDPRADIIWR